MNPVSLGKVACPVCGVACDLKLTKKNKAYVTCSSEVGCGSQTFARGDIADKKLRDKITAIAAAAVEQAAIPAPQAKPKAAPAVTVTKHSSEGETVVEDRTIFDILGSIGKAK